MPDDSGLPWSKEMEAEYNAMVEKRKKAMTDKSFTPIPPADHGCWLDVTQFIFAMLLRSY